MSSRTWQTAALSLVALNMGTTFAHVLEMPVKMRLSGADYLLVQGIYQGFGKVGAVLEPGSILAAALMTAQRRGRRPAFERSLAGTSALAALASWFLFVSPMNARMAGWSRAELPADWTRTRDQWEYAHAARFALQLAGFTALLRAALADEPLPAVH